MTDYEREVQRQCSRTDVPDGHLPVHKWYLRMERPQDVTAPVAPRDDLTVLRAHRPTVDFYRFLYDRAGEDYLWGDRRRWNDEQIAQAISPDSVHLMVLYAAGVPAGFFELDFGSADASNVNYFGLLPGFLGGGLGRYLLTACIHYAGATRAAPLTLDTCSLDHPAALENYRKRGFVVMREVDFTDPDPRLDGTIPRDAGQHVPLARGAV